MAPATSPRGLTRGRRGKLRRQRDRETPAGREGGAQRGRAQMILARWQAPLPLAREVETVAPLMLDGDVRAIGEDDEWACTRERFNADASRHALQHHRPPAVRRAMVVAVIDERGDLERHGSAGADDRVLHVRCVGAGLHPHALVDERVGPTPRPHGHRPVEDKALEVTMAGRIDGAIVGPPVRAERTVESLVVDALVQLADEECAADRRRQRRHQEAVIASCQESSHRSRREAADPVGAQPLPRFRRRQPAGDVATEVDDHRSTTCTACPSGARTSLALLKPRNACLNVTTEAEISRVQLFASWSKRFLTPSANTRICVWRRSFARTSDGNGRAAQGATYSSSSTPGLPGASSAVMCRRAPGTLLKCSCSGP